MSILIMIAFVFVLVLMAGYVMLSTTSDEYGVSDFGDTRVCALPTSRMSPTLKNGDLVFLNSTLSASDYAEGDIITFKIKLSSEIDRSQGLISESGLDIILTSRITSIVQNGLITSFVTGADTNIDMDGNVINDMWTVAPADVIGRYEGVSLAGLGGLYMTLRTPLGFLLILILPITMFFAYQIIMFTRKMGARMLQGKNDRSSGKLAAYGIDEAKKQEYLQRYKDNRDTSAVEENKKEKL